ncbi:MAG: hypothetical protein AB1631_32385 [Acidobacteriota bacterium]
MTVAEAINLFFDQTSPPAAYRLSLALVETYFKGSMDDLDPASLRCFLSRWFIESQAESPSPEELIRALKVFLEWAEKGAGYKFASEQKALLDEMRVALPRAMEIFSRLSSHLARQGGAFGFAEFLTSFEEGGQSRYEMGAMEGYFRIVKIDGCRVEAEESVTETRVCPIIFPREVARLLEPGMIINLEIVRLNEGWQITACGFAYPPGVEI